MHPVIKTAANRGWREFNDPSDLLRSGTVGEVAATRQSAFGSRRAGFLNSTVFLIWQRYHVTLPNRVTGDDGGAGDLRRYVFGTASVSSVR
jgi:hypothetical protein